MSHLVEDREGEEAQINAKTVKIKDNLKRSGQRECRLCTLAYKDACELRIY